MKKYSPIFELLIVIDCFFNFLSGGRGDVTISARVGHHTSSQRHMKNKLMWEKARIKIDKAFEPIDGKGHCYSAYQAKPQDDYTDNSTYGVRMVLFFVRLACPIIYLVNKRIAKARG